MIHNDVGPKRVTNSPAGADPLLGHQILFDVITNHALRGVLASTKRIISIASATPGPLWALDPSKAAPLSCVVLVPMLHGGPAWVSQNVELFLLSTPAKGEQFYR